MDACTFPENHTGGKSNRVFGRPLLWRQIAPAFLAMHRWGAITAEQFAGLTGHAHGYVIKSLARKLSTGGRSAQIARIVPTKEPYSPKPPNFYSLAQAGYEELCRLVEGEWNEDPEIALGKFIPPVESVHYDERMPHRLKTIDILTAAERSACADLGNTVIDDMIAEFRFWDGKRHPTAMRTPEGRRFKADGAIIMSRGDHRWIDFLEVDMGTETLSSVSPRKLWETIEGKFKSYWSVMGAAMVAERFGVLPHFRVLFIAPSAARADNMAALSMGCGLMPIDGVTPADAFRFTTHAQAEADFYGGHWKRGDGALDPLVGRSS